MRCEIIRCDTCNKEHNAQDILPREWIATKQREGYCDEEDHHFCSKPCLIKWASIGIAACDVEIMVDVIKKNGDIAQRERERKHPKYNPFCNDVIRDSQGNEIGRAK